MLLVSSTGVDVIWAHADILIQEDLSQARTQIEQLEESNKSLGEQNVSLQSRIDQLHQEGEQRSKELSTLRNRTTLSQQNWLKEREDLLSREAVVREEFEAAKQAMQDWEVLAMEERSIRENLTDRVSVLEEQLSGQTEAFERVTSERDDLSRTVDGLQRALQDLQDGQYYLCVRLFIFNPKILCSTQTRAA